jgi:hypothetical protein
MRVGLGMDSSTTVKQRRSLLIAPSNNCEEHLCRAGTSTTEKVPSDPAMLRDLVNQLSASHLVWCTSEGWTTRPALGMWAALFDPMRRSGDGCSSSGRLSPAPHRWRCPPSFSPRRLWRFFQASRGRRWSCRACRTIPTAGGCRREPPGSADTGRRRRPGRFRGGCSPAR